MKSCHVPISSAIYLKHTGARRFALGKHYGISRIHWAVDVAGGKATRYPDLNCRPARILINHRRSNLSHPASNPRPWENPAIPFYMSHLAWVYMVITNRNLGTEINRNVLLRVQTGCLKEIKLNL